MPILSGMVEDRAVEAVQRFIQETMNAKGINRGEMARRLDVSPPRVSQMLNQEGNLTLHSLARISAALGEPITIDALKR